MKQLLLLIALIFTSLCFGQQVYFSVGSGYNFGMAKQTLDNIGFENSDYDMVTPGMSLRNQIYISLGEGFTSTGTIGYELIPGLAIEVSGAYTSGQTFNSTINYHIYDISTPIYLIRRQSLQANTCLFGPALRYRVSYGKLNLYAHCQFLLLKSRIHYNWEQDPQPTSQGSLSYINYKLEYFGGFGYGASASFGASVSLGKHWKIFGEARMNSVSYAPTKGIYTYYESNGVNEVDQMTYSERNIRFVDHTDPQYPYDVNEPQERLRTAYPFSSFGVQLGVSFCLNSITDRSDE